VDESEFERLYREAGPRLVASTYAACGNLQEAQDCVQESFVKAWLRRHDLDVARSPEAWVRVSALRIAVSRGRWR
jgi:RNA polymerase sigma-70 factor, ECF subfamily